jgi:hypothetical protein
MEINKNYSFWGGEGRGGGGRIVTIKELIVDRLMKERILLQDRFRSYSSRARIVKSVKRQPKG